MTRSHYRAAVAALLCLALAACAGPRSPTGPEQAPLTQKERAVLGAMLLDPTYGGGFIRSLRAVYPAEAEQLARVVTEAYGNGRSEAEVTAITSRMGEEIRRRHADGLLQAEDARLIAFLSGGLEVYDQLADRPAQCAAFFREAWSGLSPETQERIGPAIGDASRIEIEAAAQGERSPVGRTATAEALETARLRVIGRLSPEQTTALADQSKDAPLCDAVRALMRAMVADDGPDADAFRAKTVWKLASS